MITTAQIVARIIDQIAPGLFRWIGSTNDFMESFSTTPSHPACYVLPAAERPGEQRVMTQLTSQRIAVQFTLVMAFGAPRDQAARGAADAEALREALKDALLAWTPDGATDPITYLGWRMLGLAPGGDSIFWGMDIQTAYYERRQENP